MADRRRKRSMEESVRIHMQTAFARNANKRRGGGGEKTRGQILTYTCELSIYGVSVGTVASIASQSIPTDVAASVSCFFAFVDIYG